MAQLRPVDYDPFQQQTPVQQGGSGLQPVDHDPFAPPPDDQPEAMQRPDALQQPVYPKVNFSEQNGRTFAPLSALKGGVDALNTEGGYQAVGGTGGAAIGAMGGPAGMLLGGALGTAAGTAAHNIKDRLTGGQGQGDPVGAGINDAALNMALTATTRGLASGAKGVVSRVAGGTTPEAKQFAEMAERLGVDVNTITATPRDAVKGFSKVIGVFPYVGRPIMQGQEAIRGQTDQAFDQLLNDLAPTATLSEVGVNLTKSAAKKYGKFRSTATAMYKQFDNLARNAPVKELFPTKPIREVAREFQAKRAAGQIKDVNPPGMTNPVDDYVDQLAGIEGRLTIDQIRGAQQTLQEYMTKAAADGFDVSRGVALKKAMESSLNSPAVNLLGAENAQYAKEIKDTLGAANAFYRENIARFQTATAKKFGRVDRNIFDPKYEKAGSRESDEAFKAVFNSKSPKAISNLRDIVRPEVYASATRKHLETMAQKALTKRPGGEGGTVVDAAKFRSAMGLDTDDGKQVLQTILEGTRIKPESIETIAKLYDAVDGVAVRDPSTFVARRVTLGGVATLGALSSGLVPTLLGVTVARNISTALGNPSVLKNIQRATNESLEPAVRKAAAVRVIYALEDDKELRKQSINQLRDENIGAKE